MLYLICIGICIAVAACAVFCGVKLSGALRKKSETLREALEKLKSTQEMLARSERFSTIGQLAGGLAHEINNPLGIILGFSQTVLKRTKEGDPLYIPLSAIVRESLRCKALTHELLMFSKLGTMEKGECNVVEALNSAFALAETRAKISAVILTKELLDPETKAYINPVQIQQAVINLCNNAIDAMPGGGKLTVRTRKINRNNIDYMEIQVEDTGNGIPPEDKQNIFKPYFTTKGESKGAAGLSLPFVYEVAQNHSGYIDVESEEGKGAKFKLLIPVSNGTETPRN